MPGKTSTINLVDPTLDPQVLIGGNVDKVESRKDVRLLEERGASEKDSLVVFRLRVLPRANVHGVGRAAEDIILVLGICDPPGGGGVESGVRPGVDVDGEAFRVDVGGVRLETGAGTRASVELLDEDDDLRFGEEGALKVDATRGLSLGLVPRMVFLGAELARQDVEISRLHDEGVHSTRVEGGIGPGVGVSGIPLGVDFVDECSNAKVGTALHVEHVDAIGEARSIDIGLGKVDGFGSLSLGVIPETNVLGVERGDGSHGCGNGLEGRIR